MLHTCHSQMIFDSKLFFKTENGQLESGEG